MTTQQAAAQLNHQYWGINDRGQQLADPLAKQAIIGMADGLGVTDTL